ncbi:DUF115 domain-containing protein [Schleiferiaceae bacterium]|nr:DUF115 domain-containing protein [Schleiferiaceae bacterium]
MNERKLSELSPKRILKGIIRRIKNIPHEYLWTFSNKAQKNKEELKKFKNIHKGERCFLICNGPSLKKTNINLFKNEFSFGLNRIYLNYPNMDFEPNYIACINNLVLGQFAEDFSKQKMPLFLNWNSRNKFDENSNIHFIGKGFKMNEFSKDISKSIAPVGAVTYAALQMIYYMGFTEVIIVGMDHNFHFSGKPNESQKREEDNDINHFVPNYFPKGSKWETPDLVSSEYYYNIAKEQFNNDNRIIYDATINGKCDIFVKRDLETFFS